MTKRTLSDEEKNLWKNITETISRLPSNKIVKPSPHSPPKVKGGGIDPSWVFSNQKKPHEGLKVNKLTSRDIKDVSIEATLDLHGYTLEKAISALEKFIVMNHAWGRRWVLVITGKGGQGILKEFVPTWISQNPTWIIGYTYAAPKHGGDGALYVHLRRLRNS
jgi:DNA-nicking Smr family endonuclease